MRRALRAAVVLTVLAAAGWPAGRAAAAPGAAVREARRDFDEGEALYRAGHYAEALARYQAGYAAVPLPGFLVNIAQCQRRLGDLKAARATYHEFVMVAPDSRLVPEVQSLIEELDGLIADLAAGGSAPGARATETQTTEDDVHATDPATPPLALAPAPPPVAAAPLVAAPVALAAAGPPPKRSRARWWLWGGIAAAAVAGGVATAVALSSGGTNTVRAGSLGTLSR